MLAGKDDNYDDVVMLVSIVCNNPKFMLKESTSNW